MKQYLLSLRSSDFTRSGNTWTSSAINLYNNSFYKNYSHLRSAYGLDLIGDRTFVGTEVTSPSSGDEAVPYDSRAVYVTNFGEVIYDQATPSINRFVDTTSQIDLLSFKHTFTNVPGSANPTFSIIIYEAEEETGPWLNNFSSGEIGTLFIRNCKPFIKLELEIDDDGADLSASGLVFYLEVAIHDMVPPVASRRAKNILKRFPTWTKIYEDSVDSATPSLDVPVSEGGKFITSLIQDNLGRFENIVDLNFINSFINTADVNQLAWIYRTYSVPPAVVNVLGDGVELGRVASLDTLLTLRQSDYVFYLNPLDKTITTLRKFDNLQINSISYEQESINVFNDFDEMGARIALPRLYLESNLNFKNRILDYALNPPSSNVQGLKRTLRRELDIWRSYGSTPDSNYAGATPEVLEISDIETSTPYVDSYLRPTSRFRSLVRNINTKYPANIGYVKWGEGVWDYAGILGEGVSRLPSVYDQSSSPLQEYYKTGVGDFNDAKFHLINYIDPLFNESDTVDFSGYLVATGKQFTSVDYSYEPIVVDYRVYISYIMNEIEQQGEGIIATYEIDLPVHDNYATPSTFYANLNYQNDNLLLVRNLYPESSSSSPEYIQYNIFDQNELTFDHLSFRDKAFNSEYLNTETTPNLSKININNASEIRIVLGQNWDYDTQSYVNETYGDHRISFSSSPNNFYSSSSFTPGDTVSIATPNINAYNANLYIGSEHYGATPVLYNTNAVSKTVHLNALNTLNSSSSTPSSIDIQEFKDDFFFPALATPQYIYVDVNDISNYVAVDGSVLTDTRGGYAKRHVDQQYYSVPSSPNIVYTVANSDGSLAQSQDYFESATISYSSNEKYVNIESATGDLYPFEYDVYTKFTTSSNPLLIQGFIDEYGNAYAAGEDPVNAYYDKDKYVDSYPISKQTFGITSDKFSIENIDIISATPSVKLYTKNIKDLISLINSSKLEEDASIDIYADNEESYKAALNSGYISFKEDDWYIYVNAIEQTENGRYFSIEFDQTPNISAPVIVKVDDIELRNIVFQDSATPGKFSFTNTESVKYLSDNKLNLAYKDLLDIEVVDSYTGLSLAELSSSTDSYIEIFDQATPGVVGRFYDVTYTVNNAYHIEPDVYENDEYTSYIYFSSTPNLDVDYSLTYETSMNKNLSFIDLEIDQYENPLQEGFVYISNTDYDFSHIKSIISPTFLFDNQDDFINLTLISYDENSNLKPGQTFRVYGANITSVPEYITTNDNGMGISKIKYTGSIPTTLSSDYFTIEGIGSATPNGGVNSSSEGYSATVNFEMMTETYFKLKVEAVPLRFVVNADGSSDIIVVGKVKWNDYPVTFPVDVDWFVANSMYDLFTSPYLSGSIQSDETGSFTISNSISANDRTDPGIRYLMVKLSNPSTVITDLQSSGQTIASNDVTISGDIVYWNESFDNIHYDDEDVVMSRSISRQFDPTKLIYTDSNFIYNYANPDIIRYTNSAPNVSIERWVPISRYHQYQMGLLGATPNMIENYSNIHPDYGDS